MSTVRGMENGYGVPLVVIKDSLKNNIFSTEKGYQHPWGFNELDLALSMTNFVYQYIDDDEDECMITFETQNPMLPDHPSLQEGSQIHVQWGYIGGITTMRSIRIARLRTRYNDNKIIFDIKCTDSAAIISSLKSKKNRLLDQETDSLTTFVAFYKATFKRANFNFRIIDNGVEVLEREQIERLAKETITGKGSESVGKDIRLIKKVGDEEIPIMDFIKTMTMVDDGRSVKDIIDEAFSKAPGGPYKIDTRDNEAVIHNRTTSFNNKPKKVYYFRTESSKGDLLTVVTDIKDKVENIKATNGQSISEDDKAEAEQQDIYTGEGDFELNLGFHETIRLVGGFTSQSQRKELEEYANSVGGKDLNKFKRKLAEVYINDLMDRFKVDKELTRTTLNLPDIQRTEAITNRTGYNETVLSIDSTGAAFEEMKYIPATDDGNRRAGFDSNGTSSTTSIPFVEFITLPLLEATLRNTVINIVRDKEQLSRTADFTIIGDPSLEGRDLISLQGVASVHAGKHYVKKCKHQINSSGYTTVCETYQESPRVQQLLALFRKANNNKNRDDKGELTKEQEENSTYLEPISSTLENTIDWEYQQALDAVKDEVDYRVNDIEAERKKHEALKQEWADNIANGTTKLSFEEYKQQNLAIELGTYGNDAGALRDATGLDQQIVDVPAVSDSTALEDRLKDLKQIKADQDLDRR